MPIYVYQCSRCDVRTEGFLRRLGVALWGGGGNGDAKARGLLGPRVRRGHDCEGRRKSLEFLRFPRRGADADPVATGEAAENPGSGGWIFRHGPGMTQEKKPAR